MKNKLFTKFKEQNSILPNILRLYKIVQLVSQLSKWQTINSGETIVGSHESDK